MTPTIDPGARCGAVALIVTDLERSLTYYQSNIGLHLNRSKGNQAWLGAGGKDLLQLTAQPGARPVQAGRTGLYHFAILTPNRVELARTLQHLLATNTPIGGASDHGVSEALYLADPDGHGIEIYRDRLRTEWPITNGRLTMVTEPLDARGLLATAAAAEPWRGLHPDTTIGHVHLHVANLEAADAYYIDVLGMERMQRYGAQADFVSAGGYHHHLGLNTWAGVGAPPPPPDAARLDWYEILLPTTAALLPVIDRLATAGVPVTQEDDRWRTVDPSGNQLVLRVG